MTKKVTLNSVSPLNEHTTFNNQETVTFKKSIAPPWASQVALQMKNLPDHAGEVRDSGLIPGPGGCPGEEHGNTLQYSCLENPTDRGAWRAAVHWVAKSRARLKQQHIHSLSLGIIINVMMRKRDEKNSHWTLTDRRVR